MSEKKHIDRLFQESFKDFEATPSDAVWKNIEANLKKKKKRRVIPIWWRYAGVAALLLLLLTIGVIYFSDNDNTTPIEVVDETMNPNDPEAKTQNDLNDENTVVSSSGDEGVTPENVENTNTPSDNTVSQKETSIAETSGGKDKNESRVDKTSKTNLNKTQGNNAIAKNTEDINSTKEAQNNVKNNAVAHVNSEEDKNDLLQNQSTNTNPVADTYETDQTKNELTDNKKETVAENKKEEKSLTIEEALEEHNELLEESKKTSRWAIAPNAAPVYFNTLGQGSSIDPQFNGNSKSGEVNMSYGISASYAVSDKISIRSGINRVNLGYNTNDVVIFQTAGVGVQSSLRNVREGAGSNIASDNISIASESNFNDVPLVFNSTNTTLNQTFGYIEVPLEVQYALSDKKLGVNVIGGFSSFFLNSNKIFSEAENGPRTFLGEASNLNKVSYSANFGLGFNYNISEKLDLNLEPMFKYQINTFNNTSGNFQPFMIGVYTGFVIKF
ncbi:hypothetical protein [Seonamhaeicola sp.]|uniref:hypothetical protein n=1 Tax=Seonamhaeicola sp. TaxID=1912245 RepID=UPI002628B341|nr:hypothetical protein [Seonamhaeicola sp.]